MKITARIGRVGLSVLLSAALLASCDATGDPRPPHLPYESEAEESETWTESEQEPEKTDVSALISFGGDILIHSSVINAAETEDGGYDFAQFLKYGMEGFFDGDWNVVNMENPVDVNGDNSGLSTYPQFNAPREVTDLAYLMGADTAIFCNNHVYDKKYAGFAATIGNLSKKLDVAGAYLSQEEYETPYIRDVNGIKVGLLAYTDHVNGYAADRLEPYSLRTFALNTDSVPAMAEDIRSLREAGAEAVVIYLHWGAEYRDAPSDTQVKIARALCEAGADIIVGGHSHCVQPIEKYTFTDDAGEERTSIIMYSLGNLFADQTSLQTMSGYGSSYRKTQHGVKVSVCLTKDGETGKVTVTGGEYVPTVLLRRKVSGKYYLMFLEAGKYSFCEERPDIFETDAEWTKCREAYERVCEIMGDDIPAREYGGEAETPPAAA